MNTTQLAQCIRAAWDEAGYTAEVEAALRKTSPHPEEREAREAFLGKRWDEVPESTLLARCPSPFLIGSEALRYYLPAFLTASLKASNDDLLVFLIEFHLKPPRKPEKFERFRREFDLLSGKQRDAVAAFLRWARDSRYPPGHDPGDSSAYRDRVVRRINDTLQRYWDGCRRSSEQKGLQPERGDGQPLDGR